MIWFTVSTEEMLMGYMLARHDQWSDNAPDRLGVRKTARRLGLILFSAHKAAVAAERFWSRVNRTGDGCWEWQGPLNSQTGYGTAVAFGEKTAHRIAYALANGPIPKGKSRSEFCVCHHCDNRRCCRPDHLFLGSAADNMADRDAKGRGQHGPNAPGRSRAA